ncbi:MAG: hypothetical protein Q9163_006158 [Psora crenata]
MSESGHWHNVDRFYSYDTLTFTKRELRPNERFLNSKGELIKAPWSADRLQNEYYALEYIIKHTTIPVPKVIRFERIWGACQLVMERINGTPLNHIKHNKGQALLNAEQFINTVVLPQLRSLVSTTSGALIGVVIPPNRLTAKDQRKHWPIKTASVPIFNFCHNDLGQHNILMNTSTLQVEAIIDWEYSGFYPPEFEAPLWKKSFDDPEYYDIDSDKVENLIHFLRDTGR